MLFTIKSLTFELGPLLLEGWLAFLARVVCALLLLAAGVIASSLLHKKIGPTLRARTWHFEPTPILLQSMSLPVERIAFFTGLYLSLSSLPWAITPITKLLWTAYQVVVTFYFCEGLYHASSIATLLLRSCSEEIRSNKTLLSLLDTAYKVLIFVIAVATIAQECGFPIGSIVAGAGLLGLTVSLAAQNTASNIFCGLVILIDKPFSVGDWISVGDVEGEVVDMNFRSTRIQALDKTISVITNSKICDSTVVNYALRSLRPYKFTLGVTYSTTRSQIEKLMVDIQAMLDANPYTDKGTSFVRLASFGDSSINILVSAYLTTTAYTRFLEVQNDLNLNIMDIMQADGIDFAFPSTSVYIEKN